MERPATAASSSRLDLALDSRLEEIERLAEEVDAFCLAHKLPPRSAYIFNLCFDELITNVIVHGLQHQAGHRIGVSLALEDEWLRGEIVDDAPPFDPLQAPAPDLQASLEERQIGGLGTHFIRTLMDEVSYRHQDGHNHLVMGHHLLTPSLSENV